MGEDVKQVLVCSQCSQPLTVPVWKYREAEGVRKKNKGWARIPAPEGSGLPEHIISQNCGDFYTPGGSALEFQNFQQHRDRKDFKFALRPDNMSKNVKQNKNWKIECCGVYPGSKPNLSCVCGAPIGYEFGDCYTLKYVLPVPKVTKWQNVKS